LFVLSRILRGFKRPLTVFSGARAESLREGQVQKIAYPLTILALACLMTVPAQSQVIGGRVFMTAARLLQLCKTANPYCTGYVAGVADTLTPLSEPGGPLPPTSLASFCPGQMTVKQAIVTFQRFAQNNPEGLQIDAAEFVGDALHAAYRCEQQ
jgi:hypothetical protein